MKHDNSHILIAIGKAVKTIRSKNDLSQTQLASASGLSVDYISKLETGKKRNPAFLTLYKLATGLGISMTDLISSIEDHS